MVIFKEGNRSQLHENWVSSSKKELFATILKYKVLRFSLFRVGPDDYLIESGQLAKSPLGTHLFIDKNGVVAGFTDSFVSDRVDKFDDERIFNFHIGRVEFKLFITTG